MPIDLKRNDNESASEEGIVKEEESAVNMTGGKGGGQGEE